MNLSSHWNSAETHLPQPGRYVLIHVTKDNWHDSSDPDGVYFRVAKRIAGISKAQRERLRHGNIQDQQRAKEHHRGDEGFNNKVPWSWETFGPSSYFGQEVDYWMEIPRS